MSDIDIVLKIAGRADGAPTPVDGQFIVRYDARLRRGEYTLDTSDDINAAIGFSTVREAAQYIDRPCPNKRYDSPGHVNRPIRCYHIELLPRVRG